MTKSQKNSRALTMGAFGSNKTKTAKDSDGWFPGKNRGCNYASRFGGTRKGDKVAFGRRLRRKVAA